MWFAGVLSRMTPPKKSPSVHRNANATSARKSAAPKVAKRADAHIAARGAELFQMKRISRRVTARGRGGTEGAAGRARGDARGGMATRASLTAAYAFVGARRLPDATVRVSTFGLTIRKQQRQCARCDARNSPGAKISPILEKPSVGARSVAHSGASTARLGRDLALREG